MGVGCKVVVVVSVRFGRLMDECMLVDLRKAVRLKPFWWVSFDKSVT